MEALLFRGRSSTLKSWTALPQIGHFGNSNGPTLVSVHSASWGHQDRNDLGVVKRGVEDGAEIVYVLEHMTIIRNDSATAKPDYRTHG